MISSVTRQPAARKVIVGVDTHKHVHVAVAVDILGTRLGDQSFVADSGGYQALITWAEIHGPIEAFGIEGTGSYGAGLAGTVRRAGHRVIEVNQDESDSPPSERAHPTRRPIEREVDHQGDDRGAECESIRDPSGSYIPCSEAAFAKLCGALATVPSRTTAMVLTMAAQLQAPPTT